MDHLEEIARLKESLKQAEKVQTELDLRVFNLKTLYDVSNDIYGSVESDKILRDLAPHTSLDQFLKAFDTAETGDFEPIAGRRRRPIS